MKKYSSSSSFAFFESILASLMILGIGIFLGISIEKIGIQILIIIGSILLSIWLVLYQRKKVFEIIFEKEKIRIEYVYNSNKIEIDYAELLTVEYISTTKNPTRNKIEFKLNGSIKKLKFLSVADSNEYVEFIKFLKSKNENIKWKVFPSDNIMNHKLQEVYGFNYR
ncbi:hypothetical protein [Polaribacter gangjinensis]|uniref:Uncharacterized protein n=1 Tax=Polaribacter gangjinensis TaxID=574710 RepID=A0A2S7WA65_9FLAO|nr:hypothetical protein [Polaribacter gangjinensis]PQJ74161.1 hypothetical protein BTO13_02225 [Polaribacter gangjinensis]